MSIVKAPVMLPGLFFYAKKSCTNRYSLDIASVLFIFLRRLRRLDDFFSFLHKTHSLL